MLSRSGDIYQYCLNLDQNQTYVTAFCCYSYLLLNVYTTWLFFNLKSNLDLENFSYVRVTRVDPSVTWCDKKLFFAV